mgnify:CR=1 FL=1
MGSTARELPVEIPADATLLVAGPPMTGKQELLVGLLADRGEGAIVVSTETDAADVTEAFVAAGLPAEEVGVVDCTGGSGTDTDHVKHASPDNLTTVGVKFTELFDVFHARPAFGPVGVGLNSLSTLLMHAEVQTVYKFLQVFTGQVRSAGWPAAVVANAAAVDDETMATLAHQFDGVLRTRERDGQRELRVEGLDPAPSPWQPF